MVALAANQIDRMELFYYDASWRLLERRTDKAWPGSGFTHDQTTQWVWGQRYIDELVAYAVDTKAITSTFDDTTYAMTDRNFSVIGLAQVPGGAGERIRYDAYGHAQASPYGDANADGTVDSSDQTLILNAFGEDYGDANYKVEADLDGNGVVNLADQKIQSGQSGKSIERGSLSGSGNIVGYAGYIFEPATGHYLGRYRWMSAENGRWLGRDPEVYFGGGQNLHEYVLSSPTLYTDPLGRSPWMRDHPCGGGRQEYIPWQPTQRELRRREHARQRAREYWHEHSIVIELSPNLVDNWSHSVAEAMGTRTRYNASNFEELLEKLDECEDECINKLVITGHGQEGCVTLPYTFPGGACHGSVETIDLEAINDFGNHPERRDQIPYRAYLEGLLTRLGDRMCPGGKLIFATCDTGKDPRFKDNLDKFFQDRDKDIDVTVYPYEVDWGFGSEPKRH